MAKPVQPHTDDSKQADPDESPYPSIIVNRSALPASWFFWRRNKRRPATT